MEARVRKTKMFYEDRGTFLELLEQDISKGIVKAEKLGFKPTFRLNAYSDILWENYGIIDKFSDVTFYDYTKIANRKRIPSNYQLTYSHWGNWEDTMNALGRGMNVAMVFDQIPGEWNGFEVINGDDTDLRIDEKDSNGNNTIIGLKFKGSKKELEQGIKDRFVVKA